MTSPDQTLTADAAAARAPEGRVTAVLVTHGATDYLPHALAAIRAADPAPGRLVVVDAAREGSPVLDGLPDGVEIVRVPGARSFGDAVDVALRQAPGGISTPWLWLFHDDSAPDPDALAQLMRAVEHASSVAIAGAKQVQWEDPDELVEVGLTVSRSGRRMTGVELGELNQGQHDAREDVLAVGLAGALVRTSVWTELRGTDATYGIFGDGLDLCRRARLAGHRVIVVPPALVLHAQAGLRGLRSDGADVHGDEVAADATFGPRLRSQLYFLATSVPAWMLPLFLVAAVLAAPVRSLYRIALKQPGHALQELWAPLWLLTRLGRVTRARRGIARVGVVPRSVLTPLMATTRDVLGQHRDRRLARAARRRAAHGPDELDRAEIAAAARRRRAALAVLALLVAGATVVALGPVVAAMLDGGRIVGGSLLPAQGGWAGITAAISSGWVREGLGASAPADPLLTALLPFVALARGDLQAAVNVLLVASLVLAAVGAWFAAGAATRSIPVRLWATAVWTAAPALALAVGQGRLGAVLAHVTLPWLVLAVVRMLGLQRVDVWGALRMRSQARAEQRLQDRIREREALREAATTRAAQATVAGGHDDPDPDDEAVDPDDEAVGTDDVRDGARPDDAPSAPAMPAMPVVPAASAASAVSASSPTSAVTGRTGRVDPRDAREHAEPRPATSGRGSVAALGAAGLAFAIVVAGAPSLLVPGLLALVVVSLHTPRNRTYVALVPLPALVVMGPLIVRAVATWSSGGWRILLGDPGLPVASDAAPAWQQLLARPLTVAPSEDATGVRALLAEHGTLVLGAVVLVAAVVGLVRSGGRGAGARALWWIVPIGLVAALLSSGTTVATGDGTPVTGWPGAGSSLMLIALLGAAVLGIDGLGAKAMQHTFGWRQLGIGALALAVGTVPVLTLGSWVASARTGTAEVAIAPLERAIVPAVGQQMQTSGRQARVLVLEQGADGNVGYQLLRADGPQLVDSSIVVEAGRLGTRPDDLAEVVAALAAGNDRGQALALSGLGVGAVLVPPADELGRAQLVGRIDTVAGVQRITENESGTVWRVAPGTALTDQPAWARVVVTGSDGFPAVEEVLEADGLRVEATVPAGAADRVLVLAETPAPGWHAELDGRPLRAVDDDARQSFVLGADGGNLTVGYDRASQTPWAVLQGAVLIVFVLLALPVRRRRPVTR